MDHPLIQFKNVTKRFRDLLVLDDVSFGINKGEVTALIGKSGVGKSVILKHIIGLMKPDSGEIYFDGVNITKGGSRDQHWLRERVGYLFQNVALFDSMTVYDNIALPLLEKTQLPRKKIRTKVLDQLDKLEIMGIENKYPADISGGMKKRVGLARALVKDPEIVLFDEPTTGLDPIRKNAVLSMISHMQRKVGFTAVVVTHEIPDIFHIAQKILMLDDAKIIADCSPEQLERIDNSTVHEFINGTESLKLHLANEFGKKSIVHKFEQTFRNFASSEHGCSVVVFRVNELDDINENCGFVIGQKVLQHLESNVINILDLTNDHLRHYDDLIIVIFPEMGHDKVLHLLEQLKDELQRCPLLSPQGVQPIRYTVSTGIARVTDCTSVTEVITPALDNMSQIGCFELK